MAAGNTKTDGKGFGPEASGRPKSSAKGPLILALVNALAALSVLGTLVYTRLIYKRPMITENGERVRLAKLHASPLPPPKPGLIHFDPVTVNIKAIPARPRPADGTPQQIHGKFHYVTVGFALEMADTAKKDRIEELKPIFMDRLMGLLGRKGFHELTTVQGRYILRTQILEIANDLMGQALKDSRASVTNVYFTHFIVQ